MVYSSTYNTIIKICVAFVFFCIKFQIVNNNGAKKDHSKIFAKDKSAFV
jgi:hypothetical protein